MHALVAQLQQSGHADKTGSHAPHAEPDSVLQHSISPVSTQVLAHRYLLGSHPEPDLAAISARQGLRRSQAGHRKRQQARPMQVSVHVSSRALAAAGVGALGCQSFDQEGCQRGVTACVEGVWLHLHASGFQDSR